MKKIEVEKVEVQEVSQQGKPYPTFFGKLVKVSARWVRFKVKGKTVNLQLAERVKVSDVMGFIDKEVYFGVDKDDKVVGVKEEL